MNYGCRYVIKTIPKKKKCKKAKWLSEEALQIAVKRIEAKSKGEKERYTHLNAKLQRIARRNKSRAEANRVLPRECTGHSKHPLPTLQEKTSYMYITRWSTPKSD